MPTTEQLAKVFNYWQIKKYPQHLKQLIFDYVSMVMPPHSYKLHHTHTYESVLESYYPLPEGFRIEIEGNQAYIKSNDHNISEAKFRRKCFRIEYYHKGAIREMFKTAVKRHYFKNPQDLNYNFIVDATDEESYLGTIIIML